MPSISRRTFLAQASAGATVFSMSQLLNPNLALADTPAVIAKMIDGQTPKRGGVLTYGQTYPNWALGQSNRADPFGVERAYLG